MTPISDDMVEKAAAEIEPLAFAVDDEGEFWCADSARVMARERARDVLTAALEGSVAVPAWQPIETAPKDGRTMMAMYFDGDDDGTVWVIFWNGIFFEDASGGFKIEHATHWQPLPAPPALPRQERGGAAK